MAKDFTEIDIFRKRLISKCLDLDKLNISNNIYIYPGVGHTFANPTAANFSKPETLDAWEKTTEFLEENLKGKN